MSDQKLFDELIVGAQRQDCVSLWQRHDDAYERTSIHVLPSAVTTLSRFVLALQAGDYRALHRYARPAAIAQALLLGLQRLERGKWVAVAPPSGAYLQLRHEGSDGLEPACYEVTFHEVAGYSLVTSVRRLAP